MAGSRSPRSNQTIAMRLFDAMDRPDLKTDERYATNSARMANNESLQEIVIAWVASPVRATRSWRSSTSTRSSPHRSTTPATSRRTRTSRERTLVELANTVLGPALMPGPVLHMHDYAGPTYDGVPAIGEHTDEVLTEIGVDGHELAALRSRGVVGGV